MISKVFTIAQKIERTAQNVGRGEGQRLITQIILPKKQPKEGMILWSDETCLKNGSVKDNVYLFSFEKGVCIILKSYCKEYFEYFYDEYSRTLFDIYDIYHDNMDSTAITSIRLVCVEKAYF
jgi:hypothetical protein